MSTRPLWNCTRCGRDFANRNQSHACGRYDLGRHFEGKGPEIRVLFDAVLAAVESLGQVTVLPEKTRIAFQVRMSFAQVTPRRRWLDGHVVLARRLEHPRFRSIQTISPRNHVHVFRLERLTDVDDDFREWLAEAYAVGEQRHLLPATPAAAIFSEASAIPLIQEGAMKKKSPRSIPDFSTKKKAVPAADSPEAKPAAPAHAPTRAVKPAATSAKGNRRGQ